MLPMAATVRAACPVWGEQVIDGTMVAGVDLGAHRNPDDRLTAFDLHLGASRKPPRPHTPALDRAVSQRRGALPADPVSPLNTPLVLRLRA